MTGLATVFLYYFRWQPTMAWTTGIGTVLVTIGLALMLVSAAGGFVVALGALLTVGFPVCFAGIAFRQLISNRRFALVPNLRSIAATALLLIAIAASAMVLVFMTAVSIGQPIDRLHVALLAFSGTSAYLLLSQWLITYTLGIAGFVVLPLVVVRMLAGGGPSAESILGAPWVLAVLAAMGWIWLLAASKRTSMPRPIVAPSREIGPDGGQSDRGHYYWLPRWGPVTTPGGTLMRSMPDSWRNRLIGILICLLTFPVTMWLVLIFIAAPLGNADRGPLGEEFFLIWSLFGVTTQFSMVSSEWPAGLRRVWLRVAGDRRAAWRMMERALLGDLLAIGICASIIAVVFGWVTNTGPAILVLYVAGCSVGTWAATIIGYWVRARNRHKLVHAFLVMFLVLIAFAAVAVFYQRETPELVVWLLLGFLAVGFAFRALARSALLKIDWCAVRPAKPIRYNVA